MKKIIFLLILAAVTASLLPGCKKFLDVKSKSELVETDMFSDEQGFMDALAGVYYIMAGDNLYGDKLSMSFLDVIAHRYDIFGFGQTYGINNQFYVYPSSTASGTEFGTASYYTVGDDSLNGIRGIVLHLWTDSYYAIANINNILKNIDEHKSVFSGNNYNLLKGEALGLRAFLHFDLVRLFGQPYIAGADSASIPYVTRFTAQLITPLSTTKAVTDSAIADLNAASSLLQGDNLQSSSLVYDWQNSRNFHFNALAVEATLARIYLYRGDKANALAHANNVINAGQLRFITAAEINGSKLIDWTCSPEQIFALAKYNLTSLYANYTTPYNNQTLSNDCGRSDGSVQNVENIYETTSGGSTDYRYLYLWTANNSIYSPGKYNQDHTVQKNTVPIIRLPEMYYIAAECGGPVTGLSYLNKVRANRGLKDLGAGMDDETFQNEIFKEYQKEFYSEGQLFYYYKRLNKPYMLEFDNVTPVSTSGGVYMLPIPQAEIYYGGR